MDQLFSIKQKVLATAAVLFGVAQKIDYKTLSRYILSINQRRDLKGILFEVSNCLKELLDYRLFAFAIKEKTSLETWIDPSIYSRSMEHIIRDDFQFFEDFKIHTIYEDGMQNQEHIHSEDLRAYDLTDGYFTSRLYVAPQRHMLPYHDEIMEVIVKTMRIALSNYTNMKKLQNDATRDPLTRCYNRREFDKQFSMHFANTKRYHKQLSLIIFDIDHFKKVNDTYGHQTGDEVLKQVASVVRNEIRTGDSIYRYGGEEFVIILPETPKPQAIELADRLRLNIQNTFVQTPNNETVTVTASFGVTSAEGFGRKEDMVKEADTKLYQAKANGRNTVMPGMIRLCTSSNPPINGNMGRQQK